MRLIKPHGGTLVNREVTGFERERLIEESAEMPRLQLTARAISDLELIANGGYARLDKDRLWPRSTHATRSGKN